MKKIPEYILVKFKDGPLEGETHALGWREIMFDVSTLEPIPPPELNISDEFRYVLVEEERENCFSYVQKVEEAE